MTDNIAEQCRTGRVSCYVYPTVPNLYEYLSRSSKKPTCFTASISFTHLNRKTHHRPLQLILYLDHLSLPQPTTVNGFTRTIVAANLISQLPSFENRFVLLQHLPPHTNPIHASITSSKAR